MLLDSRLRYWHITTIFWAGYAANLCLTDKPSGFRNISRRDGSRRRFLVRDATIAFDSADTLPGERLHDAACYEVKFFPNGFSCTAGAVAATFAAEACW